MNYPVHVKETPTFAYVSKLVRLVCGPSGSSSRPLANISKSRSFFNMHWVVHNLKGVAQIPGLSKGRSEATLGISGH